MKQKLVRIALFGILLIFPTQVAMGEWWWCVGPPAYCVSRAWDHYDECWNWVGWESFDACLDPPVHSGSRPSTAYYTREVQTYCEAQTQFGPLCWGPNGYVECPF